MSRWEPETLEERFWKKVEKRGHNGCWLWRASKRGKGYGQIFTEGAVIKAAHRVSWEMENGEIPEGMHVLHRCDVPACVNPAHLFLGTNDNNVQDMVAKMRNPRGSSHHAAKLTCLDMWLIERAYALLPVKQADLAKTWGIDQASVSRIVRNKQRRTCA